MTTVDDVITQLRSFSNERDDQIAALGAQVEAATAKAEALVTENAQLKEQVEALAAEVAALQAQLDALKPPPPTPPPVVIRIGATVGSNDGGLNVSADARRAYDLSSSGAKEASARTKNGGVIWVSYKGSISDASLLGELNALAQILGAKSQTALVTYEHESDIKTPIPLDVYHAGYDQLERLIASFSMLEPIVCLTGFTGDKDPSVWEQRWRPNHKKIGFDHYNKGHQLTGEPMSTPLVNWGPLLTWAKSKGKPVCIGETGVGDDAVAGIVIKTQAQWYAEHRKFVLDPANNILLACAYDSGKAILSQAEAKAWFGVV